MAKTMDELEQRRTGMLEWHVAGRSDHSTAAYGIRVNLALPLGTGAGSL